MPGRKGRTLFSHITPRAKQGAGGRAQPSQLSHPPALPTNTHLLSSSPERNAFSPSRVCTLFLRTLASKPLLESVLRRPGILTFLFHSPQLTPLLYLPLSIVISQRMSPLPSVHVVACGWLNIKSPAELTWKPRQVPKTHAKRAQRTSQDASSAARANEKPTILQRCLLGKQACAYLNSADFSRPRIPRGTVNRGQVTRTEAFHI